MIERKDNNSLHELYIRRKNINSDAREKVSLFEDYQDINDDARKITSLFENYQDTNNDARKITSLFENDEVRNRQNLKSFVNDIFDVKALKQKNKDIRFKYISNKDLNKLDASINVNEDVRMSCSMEESNDLKKVEIIYVNRNCEDEKKIELLRKKGCTQSKIGDSIGKSQSYVSKVLKKRLNKNE